VLEISVYRGRPESHQRTVRMALLTHCCRDPGVDLIVQITLPV
jgi:hypothetical protein